jgi:hypothetical protein
MKLAGSVLALCACGGAHATNPADARGADATPAAIDGALDGAVPDAGFAATLDGNRDRLIRTYYARLRAMPSVVQSNGLAGGQLADVCALWSALDPSARAVFLTITHRLEGATLADGSRALDHVTTLYRVNGGQGATTSDHGSCGGGEYNRLIMSQDAALHDAQVAANDHQGAPQQGVLDLADIPAGGFWRDSHDVGGPHAPFDLSDETNDGAPRGQTQYFRDPSSAVANAALGRADLETLVDPYALEMDQDYDCFHNSNPSCPYILYGPACAPMTSEDGTVIYTQGYGDFEPAWKPSGC